MNISPIGQTIIRLDSVDSTNNYAANLLNATKVSEGTVIMARSQWAGRGQRGNSWQSEADKNLLFSVILQPRFLKPGNAWLLTQMAALSVADALETVGEVRIKWPNDILVNGIKICGILTENTLSAGQIKHSIVGIGININQDSFPNPIRATSLKILKQAEADPEQLLDEVLRNMGKWYMVLQKGRYDLLDNGYHNRLFRMGLMSEFIYRGDEIKGTIRGVDSTGRLKIETAQGEISADLKEITLKN